MSDFIRILFVVMATTSATSVVFSGDIETDDEEDGVVFLEVCAHREMAALCKADRNIEEIDPAPAALPDSTDFAEDTEQLTIFDIPVEVMAYVAWFLPERDVYALRTTSRWGTNVTQKAFKDILASQNQHWKVNYEKQFGPYDPATASTAWHDRLKPYLCMFGVAQIREEPEAICWHTKYQEKSRALSTSNTRYLRLLSVTGTKIEDRHFACADLSYFEPSTLSRFDLSRGVFTCANFECADMSGMDLSFANLRGAKALKACLARTITSLGGRSVPPFNRKVILNGADVSGADFREAYWLTHSTRITLQRLKQLGARWDSDNPPKVSTQN